MTLKTITSALFLALVAINGQPLPECPIDRELIFKQCLLYDENSQSCYRVNQSFCRCPKLHECVREPEMKTGGFPFYCRFFCRRRPDLDHHDNWSDGLDWPGSNKK